MVRDALSHTVPVSERVSFVFLEHARIEREGHALVAVGADGTTQIPVGRTAVLALGPGCSITHAAVALCGLEGALILWAGEAGTRLYAAGQPHGDGRALLFQAALRLDPAIRLKVARRIWGHMFGEEAPAARSIEQLRGLEGVRVRAIYKQLADQNGVRHILRDGESMDPPNQAINVATAALYGLTEAVILALGYSPAIGFIHDGDRRSFVFDVADTVKFKTVVPLAFRLAAESSVGIEKRTRHGCRDLFVAEKMAETLVGIVQDVTRADGSD